MHLLFEACEERGDELGNSNSSESVERVSALRLPICPSIGVANRSPFGDEIQHRVVDDAFLLGWSSASEVATALPA
jgi:hypothetical protein